MKIKEPINLKLWGKNTTGVLCLAWFAQNPNISPSKLHTLNIRELKDRNFSNNLSPQRRPEPFSLQKWSETILTSENKFKYKILKYCLKMLSFNHA